LLLVLLSVSCATIFKGTSSKIDLNSDPQNAKVFANGILVGETPIKIELESKRNHFLEFKKDGYETKSFNITKHIGVGWVILDVLSGLVTVIVDAVTGSWFDLDQDNIHAILEAKTYGDQAQIRDRVEITKKPAEVQLPVVGKDNIIKVESGNQILVIKVPVANVRQLPSTQSPVIGTLKQGSQVKLIGVDGDWYEVLIEGSGGLQTGYVNKLLADIKK